MAGNTDGPRIWEGGDVYVAAVGTAAPTDVSGAWPAGWKAMGLCSEDGATESRSADVTKHRAWGGIHYRTSRTNHERSFKVTVLEDNLTVWNLVNPGSSSSTDQTGLTTRTVKVPTDNPMAFGIEVRDGDITSRFIIARGEVSEVGDVVYGPSDPKQYELTIDVYADENGQYYVELTDDPQADELGS